MGVNNDNNNNNQNGVIGWHVVFSAALGGSGGAFFNFPFEGLKKRIQTGQQISLHLKELYRGATPFAVSVTIATVASMTFNDLLRKIPGYDYSSPVCNGASAITSGMLGALVGSTPVENVILTQQLKQMRPTQAIVTMVKERGLRRLWVGFPELALREAGFAGAMLWGVDAARAQVLSKTDSKPLAEAAALGVGVVGAVITHPFDTVATIKQKSDGRLSSRQAIEEIYRGYGLKGFFRGVSSRVVLFTGCAYTIPGITGIIQKWLHSMEAT